MKYDVIIVLGSGVQKDGTLSNIAKRRVKKGARLLQEGQGKFLLFSGDHSNKIKKHALSEAEAMARYAVSMKIDPRKIFKEEKSIDTLSNAYFCKVDFCKKKGWKNIIVVTSDFHIPRTTYIFNKVFGKGYNLKFVESLSFVTLNDYKRGVSEENQKFLYIQDFLKNIPEGNEKKAYELLCSLYEEYYKVKKK